MDGAPGGVARALARVRVVLVEPSHPGNIGAAARALKTMGLERLDLVAPKRFPDPQAVWLASGAADLLERARVHATLDEALAGTAFAVGCSARPREIAVPMVGAREAAARVMAVARTQDAALVFGTEAWGLSGADVEKCQLLASIPANPGYSSLNLAAAVQVMTYELRMAAGATAPRRASEPLASFEEREQFYAHLEQLLLHTGFLHPIRRKKSMPRLRRLFGRIDLERDEVSMLRGILSAAMKPKAKRRRS